MALATKKWFMKNLKNDSGSLLLLDSVWCATLNMYG